jgi:hypothetical protein
MYLILIVLEDFISNFGIIEHHIEYIHIRQY